MSTTADVKAFIAYQKSLGKVKNQEDFGVKIGIENKSYTSQNIKDPKKHKHLLEKINKVYPEFESWLKNRHRENDGVSEPDAIYEKESTTKDKLIGSLQMNIDLLESRIETLLHQNSEMEFENIKLRGIIHLSKGKLEKFKNFFYSHKELKQELINENINLVKVEKIVEEIAMIEVTSKKNPN